jgi:nicotinamidase-related amidase
MQYGKLEDGKIIYADRVYTTDDGVTIINFNLDESLMLENGFKPIREAVKPINGRHYTISYEEYEEEIIEVLTYTETEEEYQRRKEEEAQQREYERLSKLNLTKADFWISLLEKGVTKDMVKEKMKKENGITNFILEGHDLNALEFETYPTHCILGTPEAELIPELITYQNNPNVYTFYKNCINGMLNLSVQEQIARLKNLKEVIYSGVCADLCVMDFARTNARYLDQINKRAKLFVVKSTIDTFDAPGHNREEWIDIACKVMEQAGIEVVENVEHLEERERVLGLIKR